MGYHIAFLALPSITDQLTSCLHEFNSCVAASKERNVE